MSDFNSQKPSNRWGKLCSKRIGLRYSIPVLTVTISSTLLCYKVGKERARAGKGATYIEVYTYRAGAHSSSDDLVATVRGDEFKCWPGGDPVERLKKHLISNWSMVGRERQRTSREDRF